PRGRAQPHRGRCPAAPRRAPRYRTDRPRPGRGARRKPRARGLAAKRPGPSFRDDIPAPPKVLASRSCNAGSHLIAGESTRGAEAPPPKEICHETSIPLRCAAVVSRCQPGFRQPAELPAEGPRRREAQDLERADPNLGPREACRRVLVLVQAGG